MFTSLIALKRIATGGMIAALLTGAFPYHYAEIGRAHV